MNMIRIWSYVSLACACLHLLAASASAEQSPCAAYFAAVEPDKSGVAMVVPDLLIEDQQQATRCLVDVLREIGQRISSVKDIDTPAIQLPLLSATSALRRLIATANGGNELKYDAVHLKDFISLFREVDDINVVSALSYAARSGEKDLRLNAVLILGNIIDNSTVCVPLTHLNDSSLLDTVGGENGRANLLGVISVVVPWAYKENYDNIIATIAALETALTEKTDTLQTQRILNNVKTRSLAQNRGTATNKDSPLWKLDNGASVKNCHLYVEKMQPPISPESMLRLKY
jgi:hypothetical protein